MQEADDIIRLLELEPHPEGGHFRETYRDADARDGRCVSTAIYFLLKAGEVSRWHRVDAAETWHWYAGAPLALRIAGEVEITTVTLVGCTVAPGFEFAGFVLAPEGWEPAGTP